MSGLCKNEKTREFRLQIASRIYETSSMNRNNDTNMIKNATSSIRRNWIGRRKWYEARQISKRVPLVWTGAVREAEMKSLGMAIGKLTPTQRMELMKMIRNYLESKGVKNQNPEDKKNPVLTKMKIVIKNTPYTRRNPSQSTSSTGKVRAMKENKKNTLTHYPEQISFSFFIYLPLVINKL